MVLCRAIRDGDASTPRSGLVHGIALATRIEQLNANVQWERPVGSYFKSRRTSQFRSRVIAKAEELRQRGVVRGLKARVARELQLEGMNISDRQVRALIE
jgi:hypothetical protein